jgi:(p)ppGpp synthase/HD superfamily hydrolase
MSKQEGTTGSSAWIACETEDRNGLLSEISTAITKRELNIISYSGRQLDTRGGGIMIFEVSGEAGDDNELSGLGNAISAVQGVRTWRAGCAWGQGASTSGGREEDDAGSPRRV